MKYAFYISGYSERLKKFLLQADSEILTSIQIVISEYELNEEITALLNHFNIFYRTCNYCELGCNNEERNLNFSNIMLHELEKYNVDYCISFGKHLLRGALLKKYENRIINFHPALLPMYPGRKAIDQAVIDNKALLIGNTAHFVDDGIDTGIIIMQSVIPLRAFTDTYDYNVILDLQIEMLNQIIDIINNNCLKIINGNVEILGADYNKAITFPMWRK